MKYQREKAHDVIAEIKPLIEKHYLEIAHFQDIPLVPDYQAYMNAEDNGALRVFTVRSEDGLMIGYAIFFVRLNIHYSTSLQASQDILFVDPDHRGTGAKFILWCDQQLKDEGVQAVYHHVKEAHNFGPMLERMGYQLVDLIYTRRLD